MIAESPFSPSITLLLDESAVAYCYLLRNATVPAPDDG